jgi:hypothetical protein
VRCNTTASVTGNFSYRYGGGLVGMCDGTAIADCYARGPVAGNVSSVCIGGLAGFASGSVSNSYASGQVTSGPSSTLIGGLLGAKASDATVESSFWDINASSQTASAAGSGLTTSQMKTASTFAAWDMTGTWAICQGTNYPRLRWQVDSMDWVCPDGVGFEELAWLADRWLSDTCAPANSYCQAADTDHSGKVNFADFAALASGWIQ